MRGKQAFGTFELNGRNNGGNSLRWAPVHSHEANTRLATYGTLSPGRANHHQLAGLKGRWRQGTVRGKLFAEGWGAALGYPGLILDPKGPLVDVQLFESDDLPEHWTRLDEFEGPGYRRVIARVKTDEGEVEAFIYVLAEEPAH